MDTKVEFKPKQVDGGTWDHSKISTDPVVNKFIKWLKEEKKKDQALVLQSTRKDFLAMVELAFKAGRKMGT